MGQSQLILQVGRRMAIPIPDLTIDDEGISCTLSFNRSPFWCRIPWSAIYALIGEGGRGGVWPEDVPPELQQQHGAAPPKGQTSRRGKPRLAAVVGGDGQTPERARAAATPIPPSDGPKDEDESMPVEAEASAAPGAATKLGDTSKPPAKSGDTPKPPAKSGDTPKPPAGDAPAVEDAPAVSKAPSDPPRRPRLVAAVPEPAPEPAPDQVAPGEEAQPGGPGPGAKKKREIPPYLRVIK
jgi:hypothetical protein